MSHTGQAGASPADLSPEDLRHLRRCVELAAEAVEGGDFPFGSVLVAGDGRVLAEDRNRENSRGDATLHPVGTSQTLQWRAVPRFFSKPPSSNSFR